MDLRNIEIEEGAGQGDAPLSRRRSAAPSGPSPSGSQAKPAATIADILERAADLIEPEGAWIKGASARMSIQGARVIPGDPRATCWCASGAIASIAPDWEANEAALRAFRRVLPKKAVPYWNDARTRKQAEVVAKLREAAAKAREQGL